MENQTSFDLSRAIQKWRRDLEQSSAFQRADLDELESHLHDSMPALRSAGLSEEEAFLIASRRIGPRRKLEPEFRKNDRQSLSLGRILWVCLILQGSQTIVEFARIGHVPIVWVFAILLGLALLAGSAIGQRIVRRLLDRPAKAAAALMLLGLGNRFPDPAWLGRPSYYGLADQYLVFSMRGIGLVSNLVGWLALIAILRKARRSEREAAEV